MGAPGSATDTVITGLRRLGPEPFGPDFNGSYLQKRLAGSKRSIKAALLDQSLVAGVGNIYADESLFAAGIAPATAAGRVGPRRLERLQRALVEILETSIGAGGTTFSDFRDLSGTNGSYGGRPGSTGARASPAAVAAPPLRGSGWRDAAATGVPAASTEPRPVG